MHKGIVAILAGVAMVGTAGTAVRAQGVPLVSSGPTFGVMAGVNLANVKGDDITGSDNRTGFLGGVFMTFHLTNTLGIQPEAIYSQRGTSENSDPSADVTIKLDYVDIPVLLRVDVPVAGPIRPFFLAGPAFGLQVKCAVGADGEGVSASVDCDELAESTEIQIRKKTFDLSGVAGAGLDFRLGGTTLMVGARYQHGFTDVVEDASAKSRTWSVLAGLSF